MYHTQALSQQQMTCPQTAGQMEGLTTAQARHPPWEQSKADSFLTAARLAREGLLENGRTGRQFPALRTSPSSSQNNGAEVFLRDVRIRRYTVISSRKTDTEQEKHNPGGGSSAKHQAEKQRGEMCFKAPVCRFTCIQPVRFKVAILPVIAEI